MPSMESSRMASRKQLLSWGRGVPPLNSVGEAWVNQRSDMAWYVVMADSMSSCVCVWGGGVERKGPPSP
mgnify:CR=1 FL=1